MIKQLLIYLRRFVLVWNNITFITCNCNKLWHQYQALLWSVFKQIITKSVSRKGYILYQMLFLWFLSHYSVNTVLHMNEQCKLSILSLFHVWIYRSSWIIFPILYLIIHIFKLGWYNICAEIQNRNWHKIW